RAACGTPARMPSATQSATRNCPVGFGFRACSPYRRGRDCGTPKPGKKKQKRYDYACAVLIIHRFPFPLLFTRVVRKIRLEVTPKAELSEQRGYEPCRPLAHVRVHVGDVAANALQRGVLERN